MAMSSRCSYRGHGYAKRNRGYEQMYRGYRGNWYRNSRGEAESNYYRSNGRVYRKEYTNTSSRESYNYYPRVNSNKTQYDDDIGIFKGQSETDTIANAPLWYNEAIDKDSEFDSITQQKNLEEEKKAFLKGNKVEEDNTEGKITELFTNDSMKEGAEDSNTIDMATLESSLLKVNTNEEETEDDIIPEWNSYTAEQIIKESSENESTWGVSTMKTINNESYEKSLNYINPNYVRQNIFCPKYTQVKESEAVWYYKDLKNTIHGPFTPIEMYDWFMAGYFPSTLEVRLKEESPFIPIDMLIMASTTEPYKTAHYSTNDTTNPL